MKRRGLMRTAFLVAGLWLDRPCTAEEERPGVSGPTDLHDFLSTYRCAAEERLAIIHANRNRQMDRFLIIALKFIPQNYVQCIFVDGDRRMLCEASSGFYAQFPGENQLYRWARHLIANSATARTVMRLFGNSKTDSQRLCYAG
jgi:hypothetical protein